MYFAEVAVFTIYLIIMLGFGVYFFFRSKGGEKEYYLGSRQMGPVVSALSAGTSDMSAWVLMGLPGAIFAFGVGRIWIAIGLAVGYILSWLFVAPRLRRFSIVSGDAITLPQYLTNRFLSKSMALQVVCAIIFIAGFALYTSVHVRVSGILVHTIFGLDQRLGMFLSAVMIILYTFLGGFKAVSWSDCFQGLLMLGALMFVPIMALAAIDPGVFAAVAVPENYWNLLSTGRADWGSLADILTGFGWGLGYFGMPHIIVRFMAIRKQSEVKKAAAIGISWNLLILTFSVAVGLAGRAYFNPPLGAPFPFPPEHMFIHLSRALFFPVITGILLSAIIAASMSSADSKLLVSSSAFTADVYKPIFRKNADEFEMIWVARFAVVFVAIVSTLIAAFAPGGIMAWVGNAWAFFGAPFAPVMLLSLFWKRFTFVGAISGIITGALTVVIWLTVPFFAVAEGTAVPGGLVAGSLAHATRLFSLVPGFIAGLIAAVTATLLSKKPDAEIEKLYDDAVALTD